jgi:hypothetical protein
MMPVEDRQTKGIDGLHISIVGHNWSDLVKGEATENIKRLIWHKIKKGIVRLLITALRDFLAYNICIYAYAAHGDNVSVTPYCLCFLKT